MIELTQQEKDCCQRLDAAYGLPHGTTEEVIVKFIANEFELAVKGTSTIKAPVGVIRLREEMRGVQYRDTGRYRDQRKYAERKKLLDI